MARRSRADSEAKRRQWRAAKTCRAARNFFGKCEASHTQESKAPLLMNDSNAEKFAGREGETVIRTAMLLGSHAAGARWRLASDAAGKLRERRLKMTMTDTLGYFAASLVLATFCAKTMIPLRALAIASNLAFIAYALSAHLWPILLLHAIMLPLNAARLREALGMNIGPAIETALVRD